MKTKCADQRCDLESKRLAMPDIPVPGVREEFRFKRRQPAPMDARKIGVPTDRPSAPSRSAQSAAQSRRRQISPRSLSVGAARRWLSDFAKSLRFGLVRTIRSKTEARSPSACLPRPMTGLNSIGEPPVASDSGKPRRSPESGLESGRSDKRFIPALIPSGDSGPA